MREIPLSRPWVTEDDKRAVMEVLESPHLALGPKLREFEELSARLAGVKHAIAVSSGTAGLSSLALALGWKSGDDILTPSFSFVASANTLMHAGARPVFVDIDPDTLNMDPRHAASLITSKTRGIQAVDVFGLPFDAEAIEILCRSKNLELVEDSCEAVGARHADGRMAGSLGRGGVWAFYPNKQVTTGEGGVVLTNDDKVAAFVRSVVNQGRGENAGWFGHVRLGWNYRMSDINSALGTSQLKRLDEILRKRSQVAAMYAQRLEGRGPWKVMPDMGRSWFVYVIILEEARLRDPLTAHLKSRGVACSHYFAPIHLMPHMMEAWGCREGMLPVTEDLSRRTLALPFHTMMPEADVEAVCRELLAFTR
ncbi:MAG: DegT/DnrJ/EryC1/StrS family aminotransferase [Planctomycetota bacterium]